MDKESEIRNLFPDQISAKFVYRPPKYDGPKVINTSTSFKYHQTRHILNDSWVIDIGRSKWDRLILRLRHPIVYSKPSILRLYRRIKHIFVKPKMIQPIIWHDE